MDRWRPALPPLPSNRLRTVLLWALCGVGFAGAFVYLAVLMATDLQPNAAALVTINVSAALGAVALYHLLGPLIQPPTHNPLRALWTPVLFAVCGLLALYGLLMATGGPGLIDVRTGLPVGARTLFQAVALEVIELVLAITVLHALRSLVLFKRTRASLRNWRLMLAAMSLSALAVAGTSPLEIEPPLLLNILSIGAVILMIANAFRLSWIIYLPGREKGLALGLCVALIALLLLALVQHAEGLASAQRAKAGVPLDAALVPLGQLFSFTLHVFASMAFAFAVLYCVTAILSLLFHLPTASAFEQKTGEMQALKTLAELSNKVLDRQELVQTIAEAPVNAGAADAAWLALIDPETGSLTPSVVATCGIEPIRIEALTDVPALVREATAKGQPLLLARAATDHRIRARPGDGLGSLLALPMTAAGNTQGALFAIRSYAEGFEQDDIAALATFAGQAALSLSNATLFAQYLEKERLSRELEIARHVQQRLLPQQLPQMAGVCLAVEGRAALEVGGDYYDVVALDEHSLGVIVADVSGKGTAAAFYMAELKGIFQSVSRLTRSPADFLNHANEALRSSLGKQAFISAVYGVLDTRQGTFTFARAGHCPIVLARASGTHTLLRARGLGLGLDAGPLFRRALTEETVPLEPGDTFVLYTDGLVESRAPSGEEYGYDRLAMTAAAHVHRPADQVLDILLTDRRRFTGHDHLDDDLSLVVLQWLGPNHHPAPAPHQHPQPLAISPAPLPLDA